MSIKYLSVCSGVEAASQAWQPLGWEAVAFSEIEPFPCAVLASRFPNVPNLGDMSKIHYNRNTKELYNDTTRIVCRDGIDLLVGGTPCQSFSVAGKRAGLEGASGLAYHYARLIGEIQPRWFVWENVPGALSSVTYGDQRDFNFLLQQFSIGGDADLGIRWNLCWRVLDTQYVRVESFPRAIPQRRRRVFIIGHLATDCGGGCEVLLEPEGVRGNPAPRRVKGQGAARNPQARVGGADGARYRGGCAIQGSMIGRKDKNGPQGDGVGGEVMFTQNCIDRHGVATESIGFDPSPRECLKRQHIEVGDTMQNGTCPGHHNAVAIRTANGVECLTPSADHPQTHRVYGTNGAYPSMMCNGGKAGQDQSAICVKTANTKSNGDDVNASGIHETQVHCALDTTDPNPTKAQGGVVIAQGVDFYNQTVADTSMTLASAAATDKNHIGGVAIGISTKQQSLATAVEAAPTMGADDYKEPAITRGRGSADDVHSIAIGINCQGGSNPTITSERTDTITAATNSSGNDKMCVAIGIGRDAFNSGKNAQMAQSISTEVQPPITAKGPGGVCTSGEPRTGRM